MVESEPTSHGESKKDLARLAFFRVAALLDEHEHPVSDDLAANGKLLSAIYEFIQLSSRERRRAFDR
jgi:hypothetical protein